MIQAQLDIKLIHTIKDILLRLQDKEFEQDVQVAFDQHIQHVPKLEIVLNMQEVIHRDNHSIANNSIKKFFDIYQYLYGHSLQDIAVPDSHHPIHPIQIFKQENKVFDQLLTRINSHITALEKDAKHETDELIDAMNQLGQFYSHYHRKEKLFFPILERYGIYTVSRTMWADDDRIRTLYKGAKRMMDKLPSIDFQYVKEAYHDLKSACLAMIFQEKYFLLPTIQSIFKEADWLAIAKESKAFGYAVDAPAEDWVHENEPSIEDTEGNTNTSDTEHVRLGGGYLTIKEANHILNNLPLEITFVNKHGIFTYFNEVVESAEMMFIRTPTSIGRNVGMCHPPKSLNKVMKVIHDLKSRKKSSETMWFKKKDKYIHITYKGLFDDNGEFLGILEYVQDIQPFLDLPREVKKELS